MVHLILLLSYLGVVLSILFLYFHQDASQLDSLIKILKYLLLYASYLLAFLDFSTGTHLPLLSHKSMT